MPKISAGLLMYRLQHNTLEVFLAHPGGPYFQNKDEGWWTIVKGEIPEDETVSHETLKSTARREWKEETGFESPQELISLGDIKQKGGKVVHAWAFENNTMPKNISSNTFEIEWPPRSGKKESFPEIDDAQFFPFDIAKKKINQAQIPFLERLAQSLNLDQNSLITQASLF